MPRFKVISAADAKARVDAGEVTVVDIRDAESFAASHIPSACHLSQDSLNSFLAANDRQRPVIVCCYRGHSSRDAARFLCEQGFVEVYSLEGGFDHWHAVHPGACAAASDGAAAR